MRNISRGTSLLAALWIVAGAVGAHASGGLRRVTTRDAVRQATTILLVAKAKPPTEARVAHRPYTKGKKRLMAKLPTTFRRLRVLRVIKPPMAMSTSATSYLRPGKTVTLELRKLIKAGRVIRLVDSQTLTSHDVRLRFLADGSNKIALYRRLAQGVGQKAFARGRRFLLLAGFSARYEALVGVAGWGLLPISRTAQVKRLLKSKK